MKKLFLTMVALIVATLSFGQTSVLATLSHEGRISTYYGASALKNAHAAAQHGDVITLSSGSFQAVDITKAVTIRGAGMQTDAIAKIYPSVVVGSFVINVADSLEQRLIIEGLFCDDVKVYNKLKNATFLKTRFKSFQSVYGAENGYGFMNNISFIHCKIASSFNCKNGGCSVSFVNSVVMNPFVGYAGYNNNSFEFTNCVVTWKSINLAMSSYYAIYRNCICLTESYFGSTNLVYNCMGISEGDAFKYSQQGNILYRATNLSDVFKNWNGEYSDEKNFELKDDAKTMYSGDDGKELGIYGGSLPFDPVPTNPQITKCNVAAKTTADGKLSVDIEVRAAE